MIKKIELPITGMTCAACAAAADHPILSSSLEEVFK